MCRTCCKSYSGIYFFFFPDLALSGAGAALGAAVGAAVGAALGAADGAADGAASGAVEGADCGMTCGACGCPRGGVIPMGMPRGGAP